MDKYIIDLDGTITDDFDLSEYYSRSVDATMVKTINNLHNAGIPIEILTARGMKSHRENIKKIENTHKNSLKKWLSENEIYYDRITFGKPFCGDRGFYVDDKAMYIEDFLGKNSGFFKNIEFTILCPFYNEEKNVKKTHLINMRAMRTLNIKKFIYVNNGSSDDTLIELVNISKKDQLVEVINCKANLGYGGALKLALDAAETEHCIITHGDAQFDIYGTYRQLGNNIDSSPQFVSIIPYRCNRPALDSFLTLINRLVLSVFVFKWLPDFNGQPKIVRKSLISPIKTLPDNFSIDFEIVVRTMSFKYQTVPSFQSARKTGSSSWNKGWLSKFKLFSGYISHVAKRTFFR